jgi:hypothetical protein
MNPVEPKMEPKPVEPKLSPREEAVNRAIASLMEK